MIAQIIDILRRCILQWFRYGYTIHLREKETAEKFWEKTKGHEMDYIASDYWKPYESIISKEKHIQSKKETFTVRGYNSLFRHYLARMRRKSGCYSKKIEMLTIPNWPNRNPDFRDLLYSF